MNKFDFTLQRIFTSQNRAIDTSQTDMALTLCTHADGWTYDYEEDLQLTPTPREEVDWKQLPLECVDIILHFYDLAQRDYWTNITRQKNFTFPLVIHTDADAKIVEYHINKKRTLNGFHLFRNLSTPPDAHRMISYLKSVIPKAYKVKKIPAPRPKNKKVTCRCSLCGQIGHNKNNRKFH